MKLFKFIRRIEMSEKIEAFWSDATAYDVAGIVNTGKLVSSRFRDFVTDDWHEHSLAGWKLRRSGARWIDSDGTTWNLCQVYREQEWHKNKPKPGPGWRLLGKFPDEEPMPGDECFGVSGEWGSSCQAKAGGHQVFGVWYRRRVEAVEAEPKHYVLRVGDTVETPNGNRIRVISPSGTQSFVNFGVGDKVKTIHGQTITITEKGFEVSP
jgi:hypothetical protein